MAHTKAKGSAKNTRDSIGRRLGVKRQDGETVKPGDIIVRQRGTKFYPGMNVRRGRDDTLYAVGVGIVKFKRRKKISFDGSRKHIKIVDVLVSS